MEFRPFISQLRLRVNSRQFMVFDGLFTFSLVLYAARGIFFHFQISRTTSEAIYCHYHSVLLEEKRYLAFGLPKKERWTKATYVMSE